MIVVDMGSCCGVMNEVLLQDEINSLAFTALAPMKEFVGIYAVTGLVEDGLRALLMQNAFHCMSSSHSSDECSSSQSLAMKTCSCVRRMWFSTLVSYIRGVCSLECRGKRSFN